MYVLSKRKERQKRMENFLNTKWLNTDEEIAYEKITSSTKSVELENLVRVLHHHTLFKNKIKKFLH